MDFEPIRPYFKLEESHILAHLLLGGRLGNERDSQEVAMRGAAATPESATQTPGTLIEELRAFVKQKLPEQMLPSAYVVLETLPLSPGGKVDRQLLPLPEEKLPGSAQPEDITPRNDVERTLITIVQQVLHIEQVGLHQNFFDLGGNSLHMVQILNKLRLAFRRELPITEIFRHPTTSSLAAFLSQGQEQVSEQSFEQSDERSHERKASTARRGAQRQERLRLAQEGGEWL